MKIIILLMAVTAALLPTLCIITPSDPEYKELEDREQVEWIKRTLNNEKNGGKLCLLDHRIEKNL